MFNNTQFREKILRPALDDIKHYSKEAEELLIATMAHESKGGTYVAEVGGDAHSALGVYQMEPYTYDSLWNHFICNDASLAASILNGCRYVQKPTSDHLVHNLKLATMMARVFYLQLKSPLPDPLDLDGMWNIYKTYYNTSKGDATKDEFVSDYFRFTGKEQPNVKARQKA